MRKLKQIFCKHDWDKIEETEKVPFALTNSIGFKDGVPYSEMKVNSWQKRNIWQCKKCGIYGETTEYFNNND